MASYQYDPSTGESHVVGINPQANNEVSSGPSAEEISAHRTEVTATNLTRRQTSTHTPGDTGNYASEGDLYQLQRELTVAQNAGNHLRVQELEQKCNKLAAELTGDVFKQTEQVEPEKESTAENLIAEFGEQQVSETLSWAGQNLSTEVSTALNNGLAQDGDGAAVIYSAIDQVKKNPQYLAEQGEVSTFSLAQANELSSQFGKHGETLAALNAGLAGGKCTRAQAAEYIMRRPELASIALRAAQAGIITLAL